MIGIQFDNYLPPSWDEWFMRLVYLTATKSKDPKTKIGSILVKDKRIISTGYNGIPIGVDDTIDDRVERPNKYLWLEHAERNSIYSASKYGISTGGTTMYTNAVPCADCTRAIIQSGIVKVVIHKVYEDLFTQIQDEVSRPKWIGHNKISRTMLAEAGVDVEIFDGFVESTAYFDGFKYLV